MKYSKNLFVKYAIDEATSSNDWLTRYENETFAQIRKRKNVKQAQKRTSEAR